MDPQGRVAIPARFRELYRGVVYLTKGLDPCVWAFSIQSWDAWSGSIAAMSPANRRARVLRRMVFGGAFDLTLDRQGRVLMPPPLRRYANLTDEVVLIGAGNFLEMWDRRRWEEELPHIEEAASLLADSVEEKDR
jgi:MraZ protein